MTDEEIIRRLKVIRYTPASDRASGDRLPSMTAVARQSGLPRTYLYAIIAGTQNMGSVARRRIAHVLSGNSDDERECLEKSGERRDPRPASTASFSGGSGAFLTVRFPR